MPGDPAGGHGTHGSLLRLILGHVCLHAAMAGFRLAAPLYALRHGASAFSAGALVALFALTPIFLSIPAGRLADRKGLGALLRWCVAIGSAGALLATLWPSTLTLALGALCLGGATSAGVIGLQRHVGRVASDSTELKRAFSWLSTGPALANFIGPVVAGVLIDHAQFTLGPLAGQEAGFRAAFLASTLLPWCTWWVVRGLHDTPATTARTLSTRQQVAQVLALGPMRRLLLVNWLLASCWDVHTFVVPVLGHERGLSASAIGSLLGAFAVAAVGVRMLLPLVAEHVREWVVIAGAMVCAALLLGVYPWAYDVWTMGACSVLLGLVLGSVQPMMMSTLHQITPHDLHAQAIAVRMTTLNLSSFLMPMVFGSVGAAVGVSLVFWTVGGLVGMGARIAWHLRPAAP